MPNRIAKFLFKKRIMSTFLGLMYITSSCYHFTSLGKQLLSIGIGGIDNCGFISPSLHCIHFVRILYLNCCFLCNQLLNEPVLFLELSSEGLTLQLVQCDVLSFTVEGYR